MLVNQEVSLIYLPLKAIPNKGTASKERCKEIVAFLDKIWPFIVVTVHDEHLGRYIAIETNVLTRLMQRVPFAAL